LNRDAAAVIAAAGAVLKSITRVGERVPPVTPAASGGCGETGSHAAGAALDPVVKLLSNFNIPSPKDLRAFPHPSVNNRVWVV